MNRVRSSCGAGAALIASAGAGAASAQTWPAEPAANYRREIVKYAKLIKAASIRPE
jgi:hypothetical protein